MTFFFRLCMILLPWPLRRPILQWAFGYKLHPKSRIGCSWIFPRMLVMAEGARIGHLNVALHIDRLEMGEHAVIERANWITGFPKDEARHFVHCERRTPALYLGAHAAITKHHHLDCTDQINIGAFTTIAGYNSQFLTHSIDLMQSRQDAAPISIGEYCFIGTAVVVLGGGALPPKSILGAKALLNKAYATPGYLYAGVPAVMVHPIPENAAYFRRPVGFVV